MIEITFKNGIHEITYGGKAYAKIVPVEGVTDTFEQIEDGAWKWHRHTDEPVDRMRMEMVFYGEPSFTMVPSVSYNGNGWGNVPEYVGDFAEDGTPWSWASHRATIPACTYCENADVSIALMAEASASCACSLYKTDEGKKHVLIFPEEEKPKTLHRHFWGEAFEGTMEPTCDFEGIIFAKGSDGGKHRYRTLLDFAWRYYGHELKAPKSAAELYRLSMAFSQYLLQRERDGFIGFTRGAQWYPHLNSYMKREHNYELGWVGQNASFANAFIYDFSKSGNEENLKTALEVQDSWLKHSVTGGRFLSALINYPGASPTEHLPLEKMKKEDIDPWTLGEVNYENALDKAGKPKSTARRAHDACNIGTGADEYFETYDLLKNIGIDKPEYLKAALDTCDFALASQNEDGSFAKSWDTEGNVMAKDGTIGCFLILPMITAYKKTGDSKYLQASARAFDYYYSGLERDGFTTAGALDTYSIDKESSSPLLRVALALYDVTGDEKYVKCAEKTAWYLCTWMMHFTVKYPDDCLIAKLGFDTFGSTSVSTPHNALDHYALRDVLSFLRLYEITGYVQWRERAAAFWCAACQGISDGTLVLNGRLRPAGSQDEAICHTRWGRNSTKPLSPTQWLAAWPCAFRLENLRWHEDWSFFDEGLTHIEGKIEH